MLFSSPEFLFLYLPLSVIIYFISPARVKNLSLLILSLVFYGLGEPQYLPLLLTATLRNYIIGRLIASARSKRRAKILLLWAVFANLALLGFYKYSSDILAIFNVELGIGLPMGISFYTFQGLSYVVDVYMKRTEAERNLIAFGTYITLFPQLVAGPIVKYTEVKEALFRKNRIRIENTVGGIKLFIAGLCKKVLIANTAGEIFENLTGRELTLLSSWLSLIFFALQIYYDFSGYTDMARGLGRIFGFEFPENFRYPYISGSITEFWRRWHITLSSWFREYVYIPLGGNRGGRAKTVRNLFVVWSLTGLWHGSGLGFLLWGIYFFVLLVAEKFWLLKFIRRLPRAGAHLYALFFILIGWGIFASSDLGTEVTVELFSAMFGIGAKLFDSFSLYEFSRNFPFLLIAAIGATPLPRMMFGLLQERGRAVNYLADLGICFSFILSVAYILGSGYDPFLYFRF